MRREKKIYQIRKFNLHGIQHISFLYFFAPKMPLSFVFQVGANANIQVIKSNSFQFIKKLLFISKCETYLYEMQLHNTKNKIQNAL